MGNGPLSGRRLGRSSEIASRGLALGVALALLLMAGVVLLGLGSRTVEMIAAQSPHSPIPVSGSFLPAAPHSKLDAHAIFQQLPLIFEPNQGQADPQVKFLAQGAGYRLFLDATGATLGMQTAHAAGRSEHLVRMKLVGANRAAATVGTGLLPGKSNYLIGSDPHEWHRNIPQFSGVHYESVYRGIDLVFYGKQGRLEYDFKVAPGADPAPVEMQFEGATRMELKGGDLILTGAEDGGLRLQAPQVYQRDGDRIEPVAGGFVLHAENRVGFQIGSYDHSRELVIDPVPQFSTYFGGSGSETSPSVAVNGDGNIYLVGSTQGSPANTFPTITPPTLIPSTLALSTASPSHIFIAKITPSQPATVAYLTFIGGTGSDASVGLGVDGGGNAYIVGKTSSTDFPTGGSPYQTVPETKTNCTGSPTCNSVFVSELNPTGSSFIYSSYLSGNGDDEPTGMAIDSSRDVFVTGTTTSNDVPAISPTPVDFPATFLPVPYQTASKASIQFFVTKVNTVAPGPSSIAYSTYFGGGSVTGGTIASGGGVAVDSVGNIYFSGTTNFFNSGSGQFGDSGQSTDFPALNAYQPCLDTPPPTTLQIQNPCTPPATTPYPTDAFVAKISPNNAQTGAAQLLFSTYLGGTGTDTSTGIAIDPGAANIYITGSTNSSDFVLPTSSGAFQPCLDSPPPALPPCTAITAPAPSDAYVARFSNPAVSTTGTPLNVGLTYFSYLGGAGTDSAAAIAVDTATDAFVTGTTNSTDFPVTAGAIQSTLGPGATQNAFFAHIDTSTTIGQTGVGTYSTYFGGNGLDRGTSIAVDTLSQNAYFAGDTTSSANFPSLLDALQTTLNGPSDAFVAELIPAADVTVVPLVSTVQTVGAGNPLTITFTVTNQGPDLATGVYVTGTVPTGVSIGQATAGGGSCSAAVGNTVVCIIPTLQAGSPSSVSFPVTSTQAGSFEATAQVIKINNTNTNITANSPFMAGGFNMTVSPSSRTVAAGQTAPYTVQLNPVGVFPSTVSLSCSSPPSGASCNFTSSSITFNGSSSASTVLNLTTTPQPVTTIASGTRRAPLYGLWLMVPGIAWFGLGAGSKRSRRWLGLLAIPVFFALALLASCSSGNKTQPQVSGTPSGTYTMTLTATSGSFSQSKTFQVTVTP